MPVPETTFGIEYDGPALATGRMPVRDLAPALLALGELFSTASSVLYPELDPVSVKVEATQKGSFVVRLLLEAEDAWDQLVGIFGSSEASALANLSEAVFAGGGLFALIKRIGRRKVTSADQPADLGSVQLTLDDGTTIVVPRDAWSLYRNIEVRKQSRVVVAPLAREGVEEVRFVLEPRADAVAIDRGDLDAFELPSDEEEEPLLEDTQEMFVEIVAVAFIRGNKWRLGIGEYTFWAGVADDAFLDRIESGEEVFRKGDVLRCLIEIKQTRDAEGLHTEHTVIEVREHRPRPTQLQLPG